MEDEQLITVVVKFRSEWRWYRSERDYWVLDQEKWRRAFIDAGYADPDTGYPERFGIAVVDELTASAFLIKMEPFKVSREELRAELINVLPAANDWWDVAPLFPSLLVDFDERELVSVHAESPMFEEYVPDGWRGHYGDFFARLPDNEKYWIVNGEDVLKKFSD